MHQHQQQAQRKGIFLISWSLVHVFDKCFFSFKFQVNLSHAIHEQTQTRKSRKYYLPLQTFPIKKY